MLIRGRRCSILLLACFLLFAGAARGEKSAAMAVTESAWEAGGSVVCSGSFTLEEAVSEAVYRVELKTNAPENSGEAVFTEINGKSIRIRKRSASMTEEALSGENTFEITWFLPEQITNLTRGDLLFTLESPEGTVLLSAEAGVGTESADSADPGVLLLARTNEIIRVLLIAAALIWALALGRIAIRRMRSGRAKEYKKPEA